MPVRPSGGQRVRLVCSGVMLRRRSTKRFQFRHVLIIHFENFPGIMCLESNFTETFFKSHNRGQRVRLVSSSVMLCRRSTKRFQFRHVLIIHFENFPGIMCSESNFTETFFQKSQVDL